MNALPDLRGRFQFSLRALLLFTTIVAAYFAMGSSIGYIEASGTLIALLLMVVAWRWHRTALLFVRGRDRGRGSGNTLDGCRGLVVVRWRTAKIAGGDAIFFRSACTGCPSMRRIQEYGELHRIARDVGVPCPHSAFFCCWHKYRFWGLVYPALPCLNSITFYQVRTGTMTRRPKYCVRKRSPIRALPKNSANRVFVAHDWPYFQTFATEVKKARASKIEQRQGPTATNKPGK